MRILWHSQPPWVQAAFGQQTALYVPRLRDAGHDVAISSSRGHEGAPVPWNDITVYGGDASTWDSLPRNARLFLRDEPGLVVTLNDGGRPPLPALRDFRVASFMTADFEPLIQKEVVHLESTRAVPIAVSRWGERVLRDAGFEPLYVPHAVDTKTFSPGNRDEARARLGLPREAFIVGIVAANRGWGDERKSFAEQFSGFAMFRKTHPEALLLVHSNVQAQWSDLQQLATMLRIQDAVVFPEEDLYRAELYDRQTMASIYRSMNVLLGASRGEGFGVPLLEAQACGVPVVTTNFSAMPEVGAVGWRVEGQRTYVPPVSSFYVTPNVGEISVALMAAYEGADALADDARAHALAYDADLVVREYLIPAIAQLSSAGAG